VTGDWIAVGVRGRGLAGRRLGVAGIRRVAQLTSLSDAVTELVRTPYGRDIRLGMDLRAAQHGVYATLAWHLRVLAGWAPRAGAERVRRLAAQLEIANIVGHLARLMGRPAEPAYTLGALALGWSHVREARSPSEVREALISSAWGDPGCDDLAGIRTALNAAWVRRVAERVPEAHAWCAMYAALLIARALVAGMSLVSHPVARRHLAAVIGRRWERAAKLGDLPALVPRAAVCIFEGVEKPDDLWRAEVRWRGRIEFEGLAMCSTPRPEPGTVVGLVAVLAADAWQTCAALERAARGGAAYEGTDEVA
jgi:hypothetical protein